MKRILLLISLFTVFNFHAQTQDAWIYFKDKPDASYYYSHPLEMLSQRALDRRTDQGIALDSKDVPLYPDYVNQIKNATGISIVAKSKWLNCLHIRGLQSDIQNLVSYSFVESIDFLDNTLNERVSAVQKTVKNQDKLAVTTDFVYGSAANQIQMLHGDFLHQNNYTGSGMQIAIMDGGFPGVDVLGGFSRLRTNNQILGTYNFVDRQEDVYLRHYHGTYVLSTIGGYIENQYVGTAPDASFYLFITEDSSQEHPYEESLWVEAAEKADSLGVDVLSTSLGYSQFDTSAYNYTYADMDGQTTFISRGAKIAFTRGMLVVNSAGNEGDDAWYYIIAPADAPSVLSIGAVDLNGNIANFSSWGPTSDNRLKPDVCAKGANAAVINTSNQIVGAYGTSFSCPILAGTATCFWQAFPDKTNAEIVQAIKESANRYTNPDYHYGYGIPNFETAFNSLKTNDFVENSFVLYPNPVENNEVISIRLNDLTSNALLKITDVSGKIIVQEAIPTSDFQYRITHFTPGIYLLSIQSDKGLTTQKLLVK